MYDQTPLTDNSLMPYGKHKGKKLANVPADYLIYMWENGKTFGDLSAYICFNLDALREEVRKKSNTCRCKPPIQGRTTDHNYQRICSVCGGY